MKDRRGDAIRLGDILRSTERLDEILKAGYESFSTSWVSQSAVIRELEVIGVAAGEVSLAVRKRHPEIGWQKMRGFSSFAKHEYWRVKPELVWKAVEEMPSLRRKMTGVLASP
jgi:uncharacterized protein with HEPN domain